MAHPHPFMLPGAHNYIWIYSVYTDCTVNAGVLVLFASVLPTFEITDDDDGHRVYRAQATLGVSDF